VPSGYTSLYQSSSSGGISLYILNACTTPVVSRPGGDYSNVGYPTDNSTVADALDQLVAACGFAYRLLRCYCCLGLPFSQHDETVEDGTGPCDSSTRRLIIGGAVSTIWLPSSDVKFEA